MDVNLADRPGRPRAILERFGAVAVIGVIASLGAACSSSSESADAPTTGPAIYREVCATCHGRTGGGGVGPSLVDVASRYPDVAKQVALVTNGATRMPAFGQRLSARQIDRVVAYTREAFSTAPSTTTTSGPLVGPSTPSTGNTGDNE